MDPPTELAPAAMGELVDSIAAYNNSANAIGFSVYYYIDQMYSQPGLRLLAVDGVTPGNDTIASESPPLQRTVPSDLLAIDSFLHFCYNITHEC